MLHRCPGWLRTYCRNAALLWQDNIVTALAKKRGLEVSAFPASVLDGCTLKRRSSSSRNLICPRCKELVWDVMKQAQQERQYAAACERAGKTRMGARAAMATFAPVRTVTGSGGGSAAGAPTVTVTRAVRERRAAEARRAHNNR